MLDGGILGAPVVAILLDLRLLPVIVGTQFAVVEPLDAALVGSVVYLDPPERSSLANDLAHPQPCHSR